MLSDGLKAGLNLVGELKSDALGAHVDGDAQERVVGAAHRLLHLRDRKRDEVDLGRETKRQR